MNRNDERLEGCLVLDPESFDVAIVGVVNRFGQEPLACYDYDKILEILCEDMDYESAVEHFEFNIIGSWVGDRTPCFLTKGD